MTTLLYKESPILGLISTGLPLVLYYYNYNLLFALSVILFLFLLYFYRYYEHKNRYPNNVIVCPADGKITNLIINDTTCFISIFLDIFNQHTQIYPANAKVISHYYDNTGKFDIVVDAEKSRDNEKVIHKFLLPNGVLIEFIQIAGFLPRRITYDNNINNNILAGEYLGMIKFGSRVDLILPLYAPHDNSKKDKIDQSNKKLYLSDNIKLNNKITIGDLIGIYK